MLERLREIRLQIPENVRLVCVSKFKPKDIVLEVYNGGERDFGESRVQELLEKQRSMPSDIRWHFIGPLQTNKIKQIVPFVYMIHSIENTRQLDEIQKNAKKIERHVKVLLEVHIAKEEQKHGFAANEIVAFFENKTYNNYPNIEFCGLMGMATFTTSLSVVTQEFGGLSRLFSNIKTIFDSPSFAELSIGMSDDYTTAIEQGSTIVRIGSKIFGSR